MGKKPGEATDDHETLVATVWSLVTKATHTGHRFLLLTRGSHTGKECLVVNCFQRSHCVQ